MTRKCIICKKEFTTDCETKKCCSKKCQKENMRRTCLLWYHTHKQLVDHKPRQCPYCGDFFKPKNSLQVYCSRRCAAKSIKVRNAESPFRIVVKPKHWISWYSGHDILDFIDETDIPIYERRNSILMSLDPYPV